MRYTQKDIEEAKAFIRKRVEAEISMQNHLDEALLWAAKEIIDISYKYKIKASLFKFSANPQLKKEVDTILARLREMIYKYTEKLSVAVDELQSAIVDGDSNATKQLCRKASGVLAERNRLCKLNKT